MTEPQDTYSHLINTTGMTQSDYEDMMQAIVEAMEERWEEEWQEEEDAYMRARGVENKWTEEDFRNWANENEKDWEDED